MWSQSSGCKSGSSASSLCSASPTKSNVQTNIRLPAVHLLKCVSTLQKETRRARTRTSTGRSLYFAMPLQTPPSCLTNELGASTTSTSSALTKIVLKCRLKGGKDLHPSTVTTLIAGQPANASFPIAWMVSGKLTSASLVHLLKAPALMEVTPLENKTDVSPVHPSKA